MSPINEILVGFTLWFQYKEGSMDPDVALAVEAPPVPASEEPISPRSSSLRSWMKIAAAVIVAGDPEKWYVAV